VLALSLLASLALAELWVRLLVGAPRAERLPLLRMRANPVRGWEMVPGELHYTYQHPVQVNSLGLRGKELGPRQDELRVLALGDSLVYGQGVADQDTLPALLEEELRARDPSRRDWSVVNAGHRAYDTRQELALLEELGPRIDPDIVLLCWYWNDLKERNIELTYRNLKERGTLVFDTGNTLEGWERLRWQAKQLARRSALVMLAYDLANRSRVRPIDPLHVERGLARLDAYLERFAALGTGLGFRPVFVVIPDPNELRGAEEVRSISARAAALARGRGLATIELEAALQPLYDRSGELPVIPFDGHYLPEANRAMAERLCEHLLALASPDRPQ
jgi:hypothetical protein